MTEADLALDQFRAGTTELAIVLEKAVGDGLIARASDGVAGLNAEKTVCDAQVAALIEKQTSIKAEHAARIQRLESERRMLRNLENTFKQKTSASATLASGLVELQDARSKLTERFMSVIELAPHTDLSDPGIVSGLKEIEIVAEPRLHELQGTNARITRSIQQLNGAGSFEDPDVEKALLRCHELGVDAAPFAKWLSETEPDTDKARRIVEGNLGMALGIRVYSRSDVAKIEAAFDREDWALSKPVSVVVIDSSIDERLAEGAGVEHCVLSAQTDYGYNKASLARRLEQLEASQKEIADGIAVESDRIRSAKSAMEIMRRCEAILAGRTEVAYQEAASVAHAEIEEASSEIARCSDEIAGMERLQSSHLQDAEDVRVEKLAATDRQQKVQAAIRQVDGLLGRIGDRDEHDLDAALFTATAACEFQKLEVLRLTAEADATNRLVADLGQSRSVQEDGIRAVLHRLGDESGVSIDGATLDGAVASYAELARIYDSHMSDDQKVREAKRNHEEALRNELAAHTELVAAIAHASRSDFSNEEIVQKLDELDGRSQTEVDTIFRLADEKLRTLKTSIDALKASLVRLKDSDKLREVPGVTRGHVEAIVGAIEERGTALREALETALAALDARNGELAALRSRRIEIEETGRVLSTNLATVSPSLKRLSETLENDMVIGSPCDVAPEAVEAAVDEVLAAWRKSDKAQKEAFRKAEKLSRASQAFVKDDGGRNIIHALAGRFAAHDGVDSHGKHARETYGLVTAMIEALELDIGKMNEARASQTHTIMILVDVAKDKIVKAVRTRIPKGRSPFSGHEIMQLPKGLDVAGLKSISSMEVAEFYMNRLMLDPRNSAIVGLPQLVVALLNCITEMKGLGKFDVSILKPVDQSATKIYEVIHKLTGSGGQTITAALLINLLATKVASDEDGDDNGGQGFIILDNPSGAANSKNLVDTQIEVAADFGIQMITTTGINDAFISSYDWIIQFAPVATHNKRVEIGLNYPLSNDIVTYGMEFKDPMGDEIEASEMKDAA